MINGMISNYGLFVTKMKQKLKMERKIIFVYFLSSTLLLFLSKFKLNYMESIFIVKPIY